MEFSYQGYEKLLKLLQEKGYCFCDYFNYSEHNKAVILRHDIDLDIEKAVQMAELEHNFVGGGVKATYYVLISSNFYNAFSKKHVKSLQTILELGHDIGLHFDEVKYEESDTLEAIEKELDILEGYLEVPIRSVSMHRPSPKTLSSDYKIKNGKVMNSYGTEYFRNFKYLSDSRRNWREDVEAIICSEKYDRLHILTHPFWYSGKEITAKQAYSEFCRSKVWECYEELNHNVRNLEEFLLKDEL